MKKALIVSSANPYPVVTSGCERLIMDYQSYVLADYDVYFLHTESTGWEPVKWFHRNQLVPRVPTVRDLLEHRFEFVLFIGFKESEFTKTIATHIPSFCLTDTHPKEDLPDHFFKGVMTHRSAALTSNVILLGACYNSDIFFKRRGGEDFILTVARIHPDKNQLELVANYKERIYEKYGLPLRLTGGITDFEYYKQISVYIDNESVVSTIDPDYLSSESSWKGPREIAMLCNQARMFVMASPKESFCIALIEAMACGTTCVVNGNYWGFDEQDIRPHIYGSTTEQRGSILDWLDEALSKSIRIDASEWAKQFSLRETKRTLLHFIGEHLDRSSFEAR